MTSNTDKLRAVFLTALMIGSVFAAGIAFTGSAAAGTNVEIGPDTSESGATGVTYTATGTTENSSDMQYLTFYLEGVDVSNVQSEDVTLTTADGEYSSEITVSNDDENNLSIQLADSEGVQTDENVTLEVSGLTNPTAGTYNASLDLETTSEGTAFDTFNDTFNINPSAAIDSDRVFNDRDELSGSLVFQGQTFALDVSNANLNSGDSVVLRRVTDSDSSTPVASQQVDDDLYVQFDTTDRQTADYFLSGGDLTRSNSEFELVEQTITAEFEEDTVDNGGETEVNFSVSSDLRAADAYNATVTVEGFDDADFAQVFSGVSESDVSENDDGVHYIEVEDIDADSPHNLNFNDIDAGNYTFDVEVTDTTATDSANITVNEVGEGSVSFAENTYVEQQGDVFNVTVELSEAAQSGTLVIGDEEDIGYQANVSFTDNNDDGQVHVLFNSYEAGTHNGGSGPEVVEAAENDDTQDTVSLINETGGVESILEPGDYELAVSTDTSADRVQKTLDNPSALSVAVIEERATTSVNLWTASTGTVNDIEDVEDIADGVGTNVTESDTVASGDTIIHQFEASGLTGLLDTQNTDTAAAFGNLLTDGNVTVTVNQTEESTQANREPKTLNNTEVADAVTGVYQDGDTYYVVTNTNDLNDEADRNFAAEDVLNVTFTVEDHRLLDSTDSEDYQHVSDEIELVERDASFDYDGEEITVEAAEGQAISGDTTIAPGSEITLRVRSTGDTQPRFTMGPTVTVAADGTFSHEFDFSERSVNDTFTASLSGGNFDETVSADGVVVESTGTTAPETTEAPSTTEAPGTEEPTEDGETGNGIPGFGMGIALIAVLGAALLALRQN